MYERSAIVLERYFEKIFGFYKENNLRTNYENYSKMIEEIKEYQKTINEEEKVIRKFDEVALQIEEIQDKQFKIHESNLELENERNRLFNDLGENPNTLDKKLQMIEQKIDENNEELKELREKYVKAMVIFIQRQKERNKYARIRRATESNHRNYMEYANKMFEAINQKDVQKMKDFLNFDKEKIKQEIINIMIKNGKSEKIPFNYQIIEEAVKVRIEIAEKEVKLYISIYDKTGKILNELSSENIKLSRAEKLLRDVSVKLAFLNASKEYIISFLDNERMTAINGEKAHEKMMQEACKNFELDMIQINNLYELILKETTGKSTKKAYKELYNKNYLRDIEEKEKDFEEEVINVKINIGTVINSNYWRIEGIKNIYKIFQEEVSEKFDKDLSEYKIEDTPKEMLIENNEIEVFYHEDDKEERCEENIKEEDEYEEIIKEKRYEENTNEENEYEEVIKEERYEENINKEDKYEKISNKQEEYKVNLYKQYDDNEEEEDVYHFEFNEIQQEDNESKDKIEEPNNELLEDDIENIIKNSRKMIHNKKSEKKSNNGIFGKLFKNKTKI